MTQTEALEARISKLETRVQELEDERALRELLARYGFNADRWLDKEYSELFTEDGAMDISSNGADGKVSLQRWDGRKAVRGWISSVHPKGKRGQSIHVQGNNTISYIHGDTAVVNSYSMILRDEKGSVSMASVGNNQWTFQKVEGKWLIKERRRRRIGGSDGGDAYVGNLDVTPR